MLQQLREGVPVMLFDLAAKDESKRLPKRLFPDAQTALNTLEAEGIEGSVITWKFMPLVFEVRDSMGACGIMTVGQGGGSAGE